MAEVVSTGVSHMCDNSTVSVNLIKVQYGSSSTIHIWLEILEIVKVSGLVPKDVVKKKSTIPSRKIAHGRCTLHWAQTGRWADIRVTTAAF